MTERMKVVVVVDLPTGMDSSAAEVLSSVVLAALREADIPPVLFAVQVFASEGQEVVL